MLRAIKYELNPTNAQKVLIKQTCGCCRKVYNTMLDRKISAYKEDGRTISAFELINQLPQLKSELTFLKEVPSQSCNRQSEILTLPMLTFSERVAVAFPSSRRKDARTVSGYRLPV